MTIINVGNEVYAGLSSDTKPTTGIPAGAIFTETDTGQMSIWNGTVWIQADTTSTSQTLTNKTIDADLNTILHQNMAYDYLVYPSGSLYKAKNTTTGVIDYKDTNPFIDPILNNIMTNNSSTGISIQLSPDNFTLNNVNTIPSHASGQPSITIHGTLSSRTGRGTVLQAANNAANLSNHSFFEGLGGTAGTGQGPSCDIGFMTLYNPNFTTFSMGGIAIESDISNASYANMNLHDLTLYYAASSKGGLYVKGQGFLRVNNVFSIDSNPAYVGTTDFCFVGGVQDNTGGLLANNHSDGLIHAQITNIHSSHSGTGAQGAGGSMQHTLWCGLKYGKLSQLNFDGWGFRDNPVVIKDSIGVVISDITHQDLNVVDSGNVGDCSILLYSQDTGGVSTCWGNRLQNIRMVGWPVTGNKVTVKCQGASSIGPQFNYIEIEEYGNNNRLRINEVNGANNVFCLKPGSHNSSFAQTTPLVDALQSASGSNILDLRVMGFGLTNYPGMVLKTTAQGANITQPGSVGWGRSAMWGSGGRRWGTFMPSGTSPGNAGALWGPLAQNVTATPNSASILLDATNLFYYRQTGAASANAYTGLKWTTASTAHEMKRVLNPRMAFKFRLNDKANERLYIGWYDSTTDPTGDDPENAHSCFMFGKQADATNVNWGLFVQNGTAANNFVSLGIAADNAIHTIEMWGDDTNATYWYSLDNATPVGVTSNIPASSTSLYMYFEIQCTDSLAKTLDTFWYDLESN